MATKHTQIEPIGFGLSPFGDPSAEKEEIEFGRGFGDPTTQHTEDNSE